MPTWCAGSQTSKSYGIKPVAGVSSSVIPLRLVRGKFAAAKLLKMVRETGLELATSTWELSMAGCHNRR